MRTSAVAIIGGGITGWLLGAALIRRGIQCDLYDTDPSAGFSSTRNQGWLHSGAYYVALQDDPDVALACRMGARWFRQFAPDAVRTSMPAHYLFEDPSERQRVEQECARLGIHARSLTSAEFTSLVAREPILRLQPAPRFALEVHDFPLDTARVLTRLSSLACGAGLRHHHILDWSKLQITWQHPNWAIFDDNNQTAAYDAVVLTCGPNIPTMLDSMMPNHGFQFLVTKIPVLVVNDTLSTSLLAIPRQVGAPQIVPFEAQNGLRGVTICLHRRDMLATNPNDDALPFMHRQEHADALGDMYRGVTSLARTNQPEAWFYVCHKLSLMPTAGGAISRAHILLSLSPDQQTAKNLFVLYPGKFTATPVAVNACLKNIEAHIGFSRVVSMQRTATRQVSPTISAQPYHNAPSHQTMRLSVNKWNRLRIG